MARPTLRVFLLALVVVPGAARNLYQVLEVPKDASAADIKRAYRRLALQWHPDKSKAPEAAERFREVAEAYEVLGDQDKRRQYDEEEGGLSFDITFAHAEDIFKAFFGDEDPFANFNKMFEDVQTSERGHWPVDRMFEGAQREFFDGVQQDLEHAATTERRASEESGGFFSTISSFVSSFTSSFSSSQGGEVKITTKSSESRVEPDGRRVTKTVASQSDGTGTKVTVEELDSSPRGVGGNAPPGAAAAQASKDGGAESAKAVHASEPEAPSKAGRDSTDGASALALDGDVSTCASLADCGDAASTRGPISGSPGPVEANTTTDLESNSTEPADVPGADAGTPMVSGAPMEPAASEASAGMGGELEDLGRSPAEQAVASEESTAQKPAAEAENLHRPPVEPVASAESNAAGPAAPSEAVRPAETAEASASAGPGGRHEPLAEPAAEAEAPEEVIEAPAAKADAVEAAQATTADQSGSADSRGEPGTVEATAESAAAAGSAGPVPQKIDGVAGADTGSGGSLAAAYAALSRSNTPVGRCASPFSRDAGALGTARFRSLSMAGMPTEQRDTQGASTPMQGSSGYSGMMAGNMAGTQGSSGYPGMAAGSMASSYYSLGGAPAYGGQPASMAPPASGSSPFARAAPGYAGQTGSAYGASPGTAGIAGAGVCDSLPYVSNVEPVDTAVRHVLGSACCNTAPQSMATNQYGCCQRCMSNANCQVYVWQPSAGTCWLLQWKTAHTTVNAPDRVMGERVSVP